ncbi:uncharacterized protein TNCV_3736911 [Trichonephila clavipes]|nr:uncharacterized protein TNCV_3736911 [Trichonephila clavipes]
MSSSASIVEDLSWRGDNARFICRGKNVVMWKLGEEVPAQVSSWSILIAHQAKIIQIRLCHGAGASIFCELLSFYLILGIFTAAFDGEIEAIAVAVEQLSLRSSKFNRAIIFSDSKSALQILSQNYLCNSQRTVECRSFLKEFPHKIHLQWIPAHRDIAGNEHANFLAKKGALVIQKPERI